MSIALTLPELTEEGAAATADLAERCRDLHVAALLLYWKDCRSALEGRKALCEEAHEALDDLTGSRHLLANLCCHIDADPQRVGAAMIEALDTGRR